MGQTVRFQETLRRLVIFDEGLAEAGFGPGLGQTPALDARTAALLQVAVSVAIGSSAVCLHWSTGRALAAGATKNEITNVVTERDYDLVCTGAPTWWLSTDVPVRSFLESGTASRVLNGKPFAAIVCCRRYWKQNLKTAKRLGVKRGGTFADDIHFRYQGGQVRSLLSPLSYPGTGEYRERYLGVKILPANIQEYHLEAARTFAGELADRVEVHPARWEPPVTHTRQRRLGPARAATVTSTISMRPCPSRSSGMSSGFKAGGAPLGA